MDGTHNTSAKKCEGDPIFISFNERDAKSESIAVDLEKFFQLWGRQCDLILHKRSMANIRDTIRKGVDESKLMLQLFTKNSSPTPWMEQEFDWFRENNGRNAVKYLFTEDTDKADPYQRNLQAEAKKGKIAYVKIDDAIEADRFLSSILFDKNYACPGSGKIVLPPFCQQTKRSDEISLQELEEFIKNFRHASNRGLVSVYPNKDEPKVRIESRIESMKEGELVRMIGFTLHRYVHPENKKGLGKIFVEAIQRGVEAKLLILKRSCSAAKERMRIESDALNEDDYANAILSKDNIAVSEYFLKENEFADKVEIRYYKTPYVGMVLFDDVIFVEIYHLGDDNKEIEELTICGRVPVLVVRNNSPFYNIFSSHFDRVWEGSDQDPTTC